MNDGFGTHLASLAVYSMNHSMMLVHKAIAKRGQQRSRPGKGAEYHMSLERVNALATMVYLLLISGVPQRSHNGTNCLPFSFLTFLALR